MNPVPVPYLQFHACNCTTDCAKLRKFSALVSSDLPICITRIACSAECTGTGMTCRRCSVHGSHAFTNLFHNWGITIETLCYLTDNYRVEPQMAVQICGKPDSTAQTVKQLSHLSRFWSIFQSDAIETILNMPWIIWSQQQENIRRSGLWKVKLHFQTK